ncbi:protease modulator HflC [Candidatus Liberibacter africanus]|uniref:Protein HflC n=1 Tax=Candidatus Liberibacter africanus PTSAPSY TaxID=1277257 RepID=A0A0G3I9W8_LIBAF|nr:protease modulator HflC [Candidatus Liberibacter africanus]AKK20602.1 putative hydrolase serine protease transmembrane protein [Candidatus Liberibacter africanus PTSAPSY]QTP64288.1 protease modulator HflC [Candidatus Liberibacter africanus]
MMSNKFSVYLFLFIFLFAGISYSSFFIVDARKQAVVTRFGRINAVYKNPGIYFKMPFSFMNIDNVKYLPKQTMRLNLDNIRVQVADGKFYEVNAMMTHRIVDPALFCESVSCDRVAAESRLRTRLDASIRRVYGLRRFDDALSKQRTKMMLEVRDDLRHDSEKLGISIEDVRVLRTDLTQEVSQQTYDRMKAERLAEAEFIRARGREEGQKRMSIADRKATQILSEARRDSEINYGKGEAERGRILSNVFQKDPEFFEFYRSMKAYSNSLSSSDTFLVLSPDSDFFKYFNHFQERNMK